jgi:sterol desaturase/sphingolipid hydroxylase (fatty acid hydroxylase superfamily)
METLADRPELLLIALAPIFLLMMGLEYWFGQRRNRLPVSARYSFKELVCNFSLAGLHQLSDLLAGLFIAKLYLLVFGWKLFNIEMSLSMFLLLMVLQDFFYYWFHRASHRVRWMWAAHVVHHSSENMNFSTAFRQSLMYPLAGMWVFWMPLVIIGFEPKWVVFVVLLNLGLQFFVHTQWIRKLGPLEWVFNTPSHHRVHHGVNAQYIDKNYAGVLIVWDRLFGTFEPEVEIVRYGISKPVDSFHPLIVTFAEWRDLIGAMKKETNWYERAKVALRPPSDDKF